MTSAEGDRDGSQESLLAAAIAEFVDLRQSGRTPDLDRFIQEHSPGGGAVASQLRGCLEALLLCAPAAPSLTLPARFGEYTLLRELGRGGMGIVYVALQEAPRREVALKILPAFAGGNAQRLARFQREIAVTARFSDPLVVPVFQSGVISGLPYYTMPLLDGLPLDQLLLRSRDQPESAPVARPETLRAWVRRFAALARTLDGAHRSGVVHRDLKPGNLFLGNDGRLLLLDFGLASDSAADSMTGSADALGTPRFMSPEQVIGGAVDGRTDVYSLAATLYEVLALAPAVPGIDREAIFRQILSRDPVPLRRHEPRVPRDLESVVTRALEKSPRRRYPDAAAFADDLDRFLEGIPVLARPVGRIGRLTRRARRHPLASLSTAAALLLAASAVAGPLLASRRTRLEMEQVVAARTRDRIEVARTHASRAELARREAAELEWQLADARARVQLWDPLHVKSPLLALEARRDAALATAEAEIDQALLEYQIALQARPDDADARVALAALALHEEEVADSRPERRRRFRELIRLHAPERLGELDAGGWLAMDASPGSGRVHLFRYETKERFLIPVPWSEDAAARERYLEQIDTTTPPVFFRIESLRPSDPESPLPLQPGDLLSRVCFVDPSHPFFVRSELTSVGHEHLLEVWRDDHPVEVRVHAKAIAEIDGACVQRDLFPLPTGPENDLGALPIERHALPIGSYLALLITEEGARIRVPFTIERRAETACTIDIPPDALIDDEFLWISGGRFRMGGDPAVNGSTPAREVVVASFAMQRNEVTFGDYIDYLADLLASGAPTEEITNALPRALESSTLPLIDVDANQQLVVGKPLSPPDLDIDLDDLRPMPLCGASPEQAERYCAWRTKRDSHGPSWAYDLPTEEEWERAGRGADDRRFPWGDAFDWRLARGAYSTPRSATLQESGKVRDVAPVPVGCVPTDESPFGIRDLSGLNREYCRSPNMATRFVLRGGTWNQRFETGFHLAARFELLAGDRPNMATGFRMVRRRK